MLTYEAYVHPLKAPHNVTAPTIAGIHQVQNFPSENKDLDEFAYIVSHDLRGAARAMVDIPLWIQEDLEQAGVGLPQPIADNLNILVRHSRRLDQMISDLLVYSRAGQTQSTGEYAPKDVLQSVMDGEDHDPAWQIINRLSDSKVEMSLSDLKVVFNAIISNSIKHNDSSTGKILISDSVEDDALTIKFADDGPGIDAKFHERIFQMMTTLQSRDKVEGSGIGLAVCKKICEKYGGKIWIRSAPPERGSIFGVVLPLATG